MRYSLLLFCLVLLSCASFEKKTLLMGTEGSDYDSEESIEISIRSRFEEERIKVKSIKCTIDETEMISEYRCEAILSKEGFQVRWRFMSSVKDINE